MSLILNPMFFPWDSTAFLVDLKCEILQNPTQKTFWESSLVSGLRFILQKLKLYLDLTARLFHINPCDSLGISTLIFIKIYAIRSFANALNVEGLQYSTISQTSYVQGIWKEQ